MLKRIISGKEPSKVIIIRDDFEQNGSEILKCLLSDVSQRVDQVHLFLLEWSPDKTSSLAQHVTDRLTIHNISEDPLGWENSTNITMETNFIDYINEIITVDKTVTVVFDSLSNLILHRGASYTCQVLHKCSTIQQRQGSEITPIIAVVHRDFHDDTSMNMICHVASTVLDIHSPKGEGYFASCDILHKKVSGKILKSKEQYKRSRFYDIIETEEIGQGLSLPSHLHQAAPDPTANLTFNLNLNESERDARANLVLPYIQKSERSELGTMSVTGSAQIFYQLDEADDFDEEDPDDDLDI